MIPKPEDLHKIKIFLTAIENSSTAIVVIIIQKYGL